jgi:hypothetical protein
MIEKGRMVSVGCDGWIGASSKKTKCDLLTEDKQENQDGCGNQRPNGGTLLMESSEEISDARCEQSENAEPSRSKNHTTSLIEIDGAFDDAED